MKVFVGYDSREDIAWQVCRHSLLRQAKTPLSVYPIKQESVRELGLYTRPADKGASTEFSLTRFLTPYLAADDGWNVFVDCDVLFTTDIQSLLPRLEPDKAVYVVKHAYEPKHAVKMDGKAQQSYPRKNWSSFIAFNGAHPDVKALTPSVVNSATPAHLHRFAWTADEAIGELPYIWNFLVGEYPRPEKTPSAIHYTNGGPWFDQWQKTDYSELWVAERDMYLKSTATADAA